MEKFIPLSVPNLKGNEQKYVAEAISAEWVSTAGSFVTRFEKEIAEYLKVNGAVACQSGTAGLHLSLIALGINSEHEVIVPTLTFIAAVNPIRYVGANPIFMDCDESLCMDPIKLEQFCQEECWYDGEKLINKLSQKQIKAIIVVHVFGNMADMIKICQIAHNYNLLVIEDATEALGSYYTDGNYKEKFAGTMGHLGVYSFNGNKIITTGGGGMVVSNDVKLLEKIKYLSTQAKDDEINFIHNDIGYNYRMTNIQAAMGVAQLEQLENFIEIKKMNYEAYLTSGIDLLPFRPNIRPNYWFYSYVVKSASESVHSKNQFIKYLGENNIQTRPIWGLIHKQKPYCNCLSYKIEQACQYEQTIVNLPCSSNLTKEYVIRVIKEISFFENSSNYLKGGD